MFESEGLFLQMNLHNCANYHLAAQMFGTAMMASHIVYDKLGLDTSALPKLSFDGTTALCSVPHMDLQACKREAVSLRGILELSGLPHNMYQIKGYPTFSVRGNPVTSEEGNLAFAIPQSTRNHAQVFVTALLGATRLASASYWADKVKQED